jgi:ubiquinone/menaquinone biosynthesis C-methylase UbiE
MTQASVSRQKTYIPGPGMHGDGQKSQNLQGHWVLAHAGKRVLRPGGLQLTHRMLGAMEINQRDRVVEFAPGFGITARLVLRNHPLSYCAVEREPAAADYLARTLQGAPVNIVRSAAEQSTLPNACASVVYGEAMLSMQSAEQKNRIFAEARRLLLPEGRYGIHELCFLPNACSDVRREIRAAMAKEIHVGVQPLSQAEWVELFEQHGMSVSWIATAPMSLLEPKRLLQDEGFLGVVRIGLNIARKPLLRHRMMAMRGLFRRYQAYLGAISLVALAPKSPAA